MCGWGWLLRLEALPPSFLPGSASDSRGLTMPQGPPPLLVTNVARTASGAPVQCTIFKEGLFLPEQHRLTNWTVDIAFHSEKKNATFSSQFFKEIYYWLGIWKFND